MVRTLQDVSPIEKTFEGYQQIEKEKIADQKVILKDFKFLTSARNGSPFAVLLIEHQKVQYTTTGGQVIFDRLKNLSNDVIEEIKTKGVAITFKIKKADKSGNQYWIIE
jgi:pyridoxine 5'-phosphate synthase PdxJ